MLGERLKQLREEKKLSQAEVAKIVGVKQNTYFYWEQNKTEPDIKSLITLANFYRVTLDYIAQRDYK